MGFHSLDAKRASSGRVCACVVWSDTAAMGKKKKKKKKAPAAGRVATVAAEVEPRVDVQLVDDTMVILVAHDRAADPIKREVGAYLFEHYFAADERLVRSFRPRKGRSYGELEKRAGYETSWDQMTLRRTVWAEIVARGLRVSIVNEIGWKYLWKLYSVRNVETRRKLAERIASGELSDEAAEKAIAAAVEREREGGRAPRRQGVMKVFARAMDVFERAVERHEFDAAALRGLSEDEKGEIVDAGEELKASIDGVIAKVKKA